MATLTYIGLAILVVTVIIIGVSSAKSRSRKAEYKDWKIGDKLVLDAYNGDTAYTVLKKSGKNYATLCGWSKNNIYVDVHDGNVYKIEWDELKLNKSALWRRNFEEAKEAMGVDPHFSADIEESDRSSTPSSPKGTIDGKPIELLSEVECEVYLKKAIEEEDYQTAEALRKRIEHFR
jgi:hypothetical protein